MSPIYGQLELDADRERRQEEETIRQITKNAQMKNTLASSGDAADAQKEVVSFVSDITSLSREDDRHSTRDEPVKEDASQSTSAADDKTASSLGDDADAEKALARSSPKPDAVPAAVTCLAEHMATPARWPLDDSLGWVSDEFRDILLAWTTALTALSTPPDSFLPELAHVKMSDVMAEESKASESAPSEFVDTTDYGVVSAAAKSVLHAITLHGTTTGIPQAYDQNSGSGYTCICSPDLSPLASDTTTAMSPALPSAATLPSGSPTRSDRVCVCGASGVAAVTHLRSLVIPGVTSLAAAAASHGAAQSPSTTATGKPAADARGACDCAACNAHSHSVHGAAPHWFTQLLGAAAEVYKGHFTMKLKLQELHMAFPLKKSAELLLNVTDQRTYIDHMKKRYAYPLIWLNCTFTPHECPPEIIITLSLPLLPHSLSPCLVSLSTELPSTNTSSACVATSCPHAPPPLSSNSASTARAPFSSIISQN